jgi:hypothetical protein
MFSLYVNDQHRAQYRHMTTARSAAKLLAQTTNLPVEVCTHDASTGARRVRTIIHPDGRAAAPEGMATGREGCVAHEGKTCFCTPCRDERRARA